MPVTQNVLNSPAVAVLYDLEHAGLDLAVVDGRLRVWPVERLTAEHEQLIQQHRNALVTLVRICDEGVEERLAAFKQQCANTPADSIPSFLFRPDVLRQGLVLQLRRPDYGAPVRPLLALLAGVAAGRRGADFGGMGGGL